MSKQMKFSLASLVLLLMIAFCLPVSAQRILLAGGDNDRVDPRDFKIFGSAAGHNPTNLGFSEPLLFNFTSMSTALADGTANSMPDLEAFFRTGGTVSLIGITVNESGSSNVNGVDADGNRTGAVSLPNITGTPGIQNPVWQTLVISEIMWGLDGSSTARQWIEIYNPTDKVVTFDSDELWLVFNPSSSATGNIKPTDIVMDTVSNIDSTGERWTMPGRSGSTSGGPNLVSAYRNINYNTKSVPDGREAGSWFATPVAESRNLTAGLVGTPGHQSVYQRDPRGIFQYPETPTQDFSLTIRFTEPVTGFEKEDIIVETKLKQGRGKATLKTLMPAAGGAQTYTVMIEVPSKASGTVTLTIRAEAVRSVSGRLGPDEDIASEPIEFEPPTPPTQGTLFASKVAMDKVIFNEIRNAEDDKNDWIELKNISDEAVDLTDYEISIVIQPAPLTIRNIADITEEDVDIVAFPEGYTLPAGGILLIVNTHPRETDLIAGQDIMDAKSDPDIPPQYLIASEMKLPDVPYLLILRSATDKNGKPEAFEDLAGNYFRGFVGYGTQVFPLLHTARPANRLKAELTQGQAWQRVDIGKRGYIKAAWAVSGHQSGIGYKPNSALETSLGTPGYPNDIVSDDSHAGRIIFSELMYATRGGIFSQPQWIELYNNTATAALPINLKGWKLVVEGRDSQHRHRYSVIELESDLYIAPTRTVLLVTRNRRHSGHLTEEQIYNLNRHDSSYSKLGLRENRMLPAEGFALKLLSPDGTLVDSAGNLDGKRFVDTPSWKLPSGYTEDGARTSLLRKYADDVALDGTLATSWVRAADVELPLALYYGHETDIGSPGYREGGIAPVMLSHFRARRTEAGVMVEWATVSETDNAGFNILRGREKTSAFVQINPTLIQGSGTTADKQQYTYRDPTAKTDVPYSYRLEEVSLSGERRVVSTVRLRGHLSATGKYLWKWADMKSVDEKNP